MKIYCHTIYSESNEPQTYNVKMNSLRWHLFFFPYVLCNCWLSSWDVGDCQCGTLRNDSMPLAWDVYICVLTKVEIRFWRMYFEVCFVVLINATRVFILLSVEIILIHSQWPFLVQISCTRLFKQMGLCKMSLLKDGAYNWKLAYSHLSGLGENTNIDLGFLYISIII